MKSANKLGKMHPYNSITLSCNPFGVERTTGAFFVERRIIEFFKRQIDTLPKNDCTAGYLSGELMAWGLVKLISEETERELEGLLCKEWSAVFEARLQK
ncbi:hypothetical protein [Candidatus Ferrigenium straubiae]|jgi:hypothetical protein|uniref:hypothetical protein n=1 Tax=Candidatus Ferrigenium straubiae TaxID=2919506 RepID=UPI003F4AF52E